MSIEEILNAGALLPELVTRCLQSPLHGWSMGSFGAIGEFSWDQGETCIKPSDGYVGLITARGGLALRGLDQLQPVAYEYLSKDPQQWVHGVVFCLPKATAHMHNHTHITELGPDRQALLAQHRGQVLFDLGLAQDFVDVAIRTDDAALIEILRQAEDMNILAANNPAMMAIIQAGPHRVFSTAMGRLEVYQPIGIEQSPQGPHTHVLPKLLASKRAFSANVPVPDGMLPVLSLHPAHPLRDLLGQTKAFDPQQHEQFQRWLGQFAPPGFVAQKQATMAALARGLLPEQFDAGDSRLLRTATRIAVRQYPYLNSGSNELLQRWQTFFEARKAHH